MSEVLYSSIADDIISRIQNNELKKEDRLSERKLAEEYQVSRTVIRESIKLLSEKGFVHIIYGKGSFVNIPDDEALINKFGNVMDMSQVKVYDVVEARELLDSSMVSMMIERVEQKDIDVLLELHNCMELNINDSEVFAEYDSKFHLALSMCTHNRVLSIIMGTLNSMVNRSAILQDISMRINANKEHHNMIDALIHKDEDELQTALGNHIKCIRSYIENL